MKGSVAARTTRLVVPAAALLTLAGCGGAPERAPTTAGTNQNEPPREAPPVLARPPSFPSAREVLIDGVREGRVLDELGGLRLVGGAGTIALVGSDGHVRASHRFAFGADGAAGVFLGRDAAHAVVGNGDQDGFRSPWAGRLHRWDLDRDTLAELVALGYTAPLLARVEDAVVSVSPSLSEGHWITLGDVTSLERIVDAVGCAPDGSGECYVGNTEEAWSLRPGPGGSFVAMAASPPVPEMPAPPPVPADWPLSATLGARGLPTVALSPTGRHLAVGTSSSLVVLGPDGIGPERQATGEVRWERVDVLSIGGVLSPLEAPTRASRSSLVPLVSPEDEENPPPSVRAYQEWLAAASDAESAEMIPRAPSFTPVCSVGIGARCLRARYDRIRSVGWDVFDPTRPRRVLGTLDAPDYPPDPSFVLVAPGGRYARVYDGSTAAIVPLPRGDVIRDLDQWVELEAGWVYVEASAPRELHFLAFDGRATSRQLEHDIDEVAILDASHVLVVAGGSAMVLAVPALTTDRTVALGEVGTWLGCDEAGRIVDEEGNVRGVCPVPLLDRGDQISRVAIAGDMSVFSDARLGDEAIVQRADGGAIHVRMTTAGVLVSGPDGVFEGTGDVLDHVVVREPGPVRTAQITIGAEARARFERPGLVAAFFSGRPLPTP